MQVPMTKRPVKSLIFKLRTFIIWTGFILILIGGILWILSATQIIQETWSNSLAVSFAILGCLIQYAQYLIPLPSPNNDQRFETYRSLVTSQLIGEYGAVLIRTKGSRILSKKESVVADNICALNLTGDTLKDLTFSNIQEDIHKALAYGTIMMRRIGFQGTEFYDELITTFRNLEPGLYFFFALNKISSYYVDDEPEDELADYPIGLFTPVLVQSGKAIQIDWRFE